MRAFIWSSLVFVLGFGCSQASSSPGDSGGPIAGSAGTGSSVDGLPTSVEFEMAAPLAAREQVLLKVRALPPQAYQVTFALRASGGDPLAAVLDRSTTTTDDNGIGSVVLTAPSSPTTFD